MEIAFVPKRILSRLSECANVQVHLNVALSSSVLLVLSLLPCAKTVLSWIPHRCLAQLLFNIPCPGCGILHSLSAVSSFHMSEAWRYNPVGPYLALFLILQIPLRLIAIRLPTWERSVLIVSDVASRAVALTLVFIWLSKLW